MEPIPLFTDTGCRTGHYAARRQASLPFRLPIRPRLLRAGCSLAALLLWWRRALGLRAPGGKARGPYWRPRPGGRGRVRDPGPGGGECAAARYVRVRRPGNRPAGDAGTESVRREGRACHGTRPPGPGSTLRTGRRRGDGGRSRAGKLLAAPIRGRRGFTLSNPGQASSRSGEPRPRGLHSLSRLATTGTVDPGAGCAIEARRGGPLLALEGPEADSAFEALGNALAEGPRILWPKGAPLSPSRHHPTWLSDRAVRWGQEGMLAVACTTVCKLTLFNRFGAGAGGQVLWQDHRVRPPSICIYGIRFGWVLLSGGFCSREPILYLVQGVHQ